MAKMQRTQIYLEPDLAASLDRLARQRGTSRASLIRSAARALVEQESAEYGSILRLAGIGRDSASDVAERHDDYLAEIKLKKWRR
jgi:metal-responsive CopG/Arc/MetJ family transcriptional regulator